MPRNKKIALDEMVRRADDAKKVNPLDLSSDQDLSIALMNLISLEEHFVFSGAKTQKSGFYDLVNTVHDMRVKLMGRIVGKTGAVWDVSEKLLATSMRLIEVGTKSLAAGNKSDAYNMFNQAYELYSLFWGINMGLVDLDGVTEIAPDVCECTLGNKKSENTTKSAPDARSTVRKLGDWVKNAVNCCIE